MSGTLELEETEAALTAHPRVREAAVAVHRDAMDERLVAYVVADPAPGGDLDRLCCHIAAARPEGRAPDVFVTVDRLPRGDDGAVDRAALPDATRGEDPASPGPAVLGGTAATIADIWREVLRVDAVRLSDNLFDRGGHSLAITRMAIRIREELRVEVPQTVFYDTPTVPAIAAAIEEFAHSCHERE
jgi:surfactin family lipopeptide synthetase A